MQKPLVAIISFPGNNCEVESMRSIRRNGMDALYFRWNDDRAKLWDVDAYFIPGGFSYEDRGRSGMVAGRDPLMDFIGQEAEAGKTVIGNCNGAQILVESGLIPLSNGLRMCLARNTIRSEDHYHAVGFVNEWIWMERTCERDRCATSGWDGVMHLPIAHGEGRFVTRDRDLFEELRKNEQLAFSYCDARGNVSHDPVVTPNGSTFAVAGICNPAGNVVAIMPHPERTRNGDPYFQALRDWLVAKRRTPSLVRDRPEIQPQQMSDHAMDDGLVELFIDTIIVNNEERTVEQIARRYNPVLRLKQWKYLAIPEERVDGALRDLTIFNPHKERVYLRRGGSIDRWNAYRKSGEALAESEISRIFRGVLLLRRDQPDAGAEGFGPKAQTGVCYACQGVDLDAFSDHRLREVFCNPHSSTLERIPL